jgi:hypothetical protein
VIYQGKWVDVPKVDEGELSFITAQVGSELTATEVIKRQEECRKIMNDTINTIHQKDVG